jgi:hypothetical protein
VIDECPMRDWMALGCAPWAMTSATAVVVRVEVVEQSDEELGAVGVVVVGGVIAFARSV